MVVARRKKKKTKKSKFFKVLIILVVIGLAIAMVKGYDTFQNIFRPNVELKDKQIGYVCIPTGSTLDDVINVLYNNHYIINKNSFEWLAEKLNYKKNIHPGRYKLKNKMSNRELLTLLRSGQQEPVNLTIISVRGKEIVAGRAGKLLEADSLSILKLMDDRIFLWKYGFKPSTVAAMIIPNTYEMYWNTSPRQFFERMYNEYNKFWNDARLEKARKIGLNKVEISIIASIVEEETKKNSEKPTIAGVYINRLKKGMRLQADPTVKYAVGDVTIKRILAKHLVFDSPYNTYLYAGLPPGPIDVPSVSSIDAVLNYQHHQYIYFCAKEDFSGYHNFSKTLEQHNVYARLYQRALSRMKVYN
jgi:UPF0755 protein